jgi:hypothetical protein
VPNALNPQLSEIMNRYRRLPGFKYLPILALLLATTLGGPAIASTAAEWESKVVQWEQELIAAQQEINRIRELPRFRDQKTEKTKQDQLVFWSQKVVTLRDKIAEARTFIVILKERERFQQNQSTTNQ